MTDDTLLYYTEFGVVVGVMMAHQMEIGGLDGLEMMYDHQDMRIMYAHSLVWQLESISQTITPAPWNP